MEKSINLISHLDAELGVGEIARRLITLLSSSGIDLNLVSFEGNKSRKSYETTYQTNGLDFSKNIVSCVNPDQVGALVALFGITHSKPEKHIGFWAWELEEVPSNYAHSANLLDEIWTLSHHSRKAIDKLRILESRTVSVPIPIPKAATAITRADFDLSEKTFLVSASFDYFSDPRRKNPEGVIQAFIKAFPEETSATLVVKSINGEKNPTQSAELKEIAKGRKDIKFIDSYLGHYENHALLELSDVHLSLHRAEGYGINLADAMARKTAVIATGYSGNLDFMDDQSNILVPFSMTEVDHYAGMKFESVWAEPDVDFAAYKLRNLFEAPKELESLAHKGFTKIRDEHSLVPSVLRFQKEFMNA